MKKNGDIFRGKISEREIIRQKCNTYAKKIMDNIKGEQREIMPYSEEKVKKDSLKQQRRIEAGKRMMISSDDGNEYLNKRIETLRFYREISVDIEQIKQKKKITNYYPLHYEPEMGFLPANGRKYSNQIEVVEEILRRIGQEEILLIKEHPFQLLDYHISDGEHHYKSANAYRSKLIYEIMSMDERIYFVRMECKNKEIYSKLRPKVWTVTGTAGLEAWAMNLEHETLGTYSPWKDLTEYKGDKEKNISRYINERISWNKGEWLDLESLVEIIVNQRI